MEKNRANLIMSWALGISLFIHCTSFIGISYFGQINMVWYLTLAMIGSVNAIRGPAKLSGVAQRGGAGPLHLKGRMSQRKVSLAGESSSIQADQLEPTQR